jgi:hypothetical protein
LSTSFLVIQAQRDFVQAQANELAAVLAYDLSLVAFEALQQAGSPGQATAGALAASDAATAVRVGAPLATAPTAAATSALLP